MTAIGAIRTEDRVVLLADGIGTCGYHVAQTALAKIFRVGPWTVGLAGSSSAMQILEESAGCRGAGDASAFGAAARSALKTAGYKESHDEDKAFPLWGQYLFLARPGELWRLWEDLFPCSVDLGRPAAIGSGRDELVAGAWVALQMGAGPEDALRWGMRASKQYVTGIGGAELLVTIRGESA